MKETTRKRIGWICLIYSGLLLFFSVFFIFVPETRKLKYGITWAYSLGSLGLCFWIAALGLYLVREKPNPDGKMRLTIYGIVLCPIFILRQPTVMGHSQPISNLLPLATVTVVISSAISICVPFLFGGRILKHLEENSSKASATPLQTLHLIGMACSAMPSMTGFLLYFLGATKNTIYYFVAISYVAMAMWWAWWRHRYFRAANPV